jgi:hypothetical protein
VGNPRYVGGAPAFALAEAVDSVRRAKRPKGNSASSAVSAQDGPVVDHLYYRPNVFFRPLSALPLPEAVVYPPMTVSDALVNMYFEKLHET